MPAARWTARASAVDNAWYSVCWSPELGLFAAVALSGAGDRVMTSPYGADAAVHAQIGEPWWWDGSYSTNAPHIYDAITEAAYVTATGLPVPSPRHTSILETPTTAQRHYLEWCRDQLGAVTAWLIAQIKISYPSVTTYLLIFTPQILRGETPMLRTLNFPEADWKFPAFDVLQIEDYDRVVLGDYAFTDLTWELALNVLDYPIKQVHYFAGFNLLPETTWIWFNTDIAIYRAFQRNPLEVFVWSREQVMRDGWLFDRQSWKLYPNTTRLAQCWKIERTDGVTQAFTSFDQPLTVDGTTYEPANSFSASQFASDSDMSVADVELLGALDADDITAEALLAGVYDHAEVELFVVDWSDLTIPKTIVRRGWIGNISQSGITFRAELRGLGQRIQQPIIESYSPECRVDLFSPRCGASRAAFAVTATVTSLTDGTLGVASDNRVFFSNTLNQEDDWFKYGELIWTTGANAGHTTEIRSFKKGRIELWEPMGLNVAVGDTFTIHAGCDKSLATCRAKFNNVVNFRGEPHVPGNDAMLAYPDSQ
ncbi:MAG: DUF2163 domain-containing protein [Sphingomonadales bacterium]|nr:DUF2163 domain-containing protein [Sphingomonadales bacterium]